MAVTLRDIADEAGVSVMTVSNVVNGKSARVSQATIERVTSIMERRGYVPNAPARSLAAQRSHVIGVLVPVGEGDSLLMSPHHTAVIGGVERQLRKHGYHLLLRGIADPAEIGEAVRGWSLDGAILLGFLDEEVDDIAIDGVPLVAIDSYSPNPRTTGVRSDDVAGGYAAGRHLIERGHRALAFAAPHFTDVGVVRRRYDGFRRAVDEAGVDVAAVPILEAPTTYDDGRRLAARLRAEHPEVTAVFATADILAIGIMSGLAEPRRRRARRRVGHRVRRPRVRRLRLARAHHDRPGHDREGQRDRSHPARRDRARAAARRGRDPRHRARRAGLRGAAAGCADGLMPPAASAHRLDFSTRHPAGILDRPPVVCRTWSGAMASYPSGQRDLTVNQLSTTSGVRIPHSPHQKAPVTRGFRRSRASSPTRRRGRAA